MGMSRTSLSRHLIQFLKDEEEEVLKATDESDRDAVMKMYQKTKITVEDMMREYTPEEVRMLCERTKVRVKMYKLNIVWDAKKRFDMKKRLENKSESYVNRMLVKAHKRRMIEPYSDLEREKYKELVACQTKKDNNARLDRWHRQRLRASKSNGRDGRSELPLNISSSSETEYEAEMLAVAPTKNIPHFSVEPTLAPLESQPLSQSDDSTRGDLLEPPPAPPLESQPQSQSSDQSTMDDFLQLVMKLPAPKPLPDLDNEPNLSGIGDEHELEIAEPPPAPAPAAHVGEKDLNSFDWLQMGNDINSESLSMRIVANTQNTESDYECFGTQVVAASTQDTVESQQFL